MSGGGTNGAAHGETNGVTSIVVGRGRMGNAFSQLTDLQDWAHEECVVNESCYSLVLAHKGEDGESIVVQKAIRAPRVATTPAELTSLVAGLVERFYMTAQSETAESPRSRTYLLVAFGKSKNENLGRREFTMHPPVGRLVTTETEAPTEKGVMANAMRWSDAALRLALTNLQIGNELLQSELERKERDLGRMREYVSQLENRRLEAFKLEEELHSKRMEREIQLTREKRQDERLERLWRQVEGYLPLAIAKVVGGSSDLAKLASSPGSAESNSVKVSPGKRLGQFFVSLSGEQKQSLFAQLTDTQRDEFVQILKEMVAEAGAPAPEKDSK